MAKSERSMNTVARNADFAEFRLALATLITRALNLDVLPSDIDPEAPLYGEGMGLDSIDILEIALVVSKEYGVHLKAESEENHVIFRSLNSLAQYVVAQRSK